MAEPSVQDKSKSTRGGTRHFRALKAVRAYIDETREKSPKDVFIALLLNEALRSVTIDICIDQASITDGTQWPLYSNIEQSEGDPMSLYLVTSKPSEGAGTVQSLADQVVWYNPDGIRDSGNYQAGAAIENVDPLSLELVWDGNLPDPHTVCIK